MNTFVFWSGGYDSTMALLERLIENPTDKYILCYAELENNSLKAKNELKATAAILPILKQLYVNASFEQRIMKLSVNSWGSSSLIQQRLWAFHAPEFAVDFEQVDNFVFGYILGDDYWHYRTEIETILKSSFSIASYKRTHQPQIIYPCEWFTKVDVLTKYMATPIFKSIEKLVTTCENPGSSGKSGCRCHTCQNLKEAKLIYNSRVRKSSRVPKPALDINPTKELDITDTKEEQPRVRCRKFTATLTDIKKEKLL